MSESSHQRSRGLIKEASTWDHHVEQASRQGRADNLRAGGSLSSEGWSFSDVVLDGHHWTVAADVECRITWWTQWIACMCILPSTSTAPTLSISAESSIREFSVYCAASVSIRSWLSTLNDASITNLPSGIFEEQQHEKRSNQEPLVSRVSHAS